ncbi:hypothetical protein [Micromonospora sp. NPDC005710]|uniref:hypothetical protein n=1 Tax=Micromonospora sp. NPDC005710 TaxID=3157051 RepID=UPI0033F508B1
MNRLISRLGAGSVALCTVLALGVPGPGQAAPARSAPAPSPVRTGTVTLVTGDKVALDRDRVVAITPAPGRVGTPFRQYRQDGELYVVPADQLARVASGRLDQRLFAVSALARSGVTDARAADLPRRAVQRQAVATDGVTLTLTFLDRRGIPTADYFVSLFDTVSQQEYSGYHESGTTTVTVPAGHYYLEAGVSGASTTDVVPFDFFVEPDIAATGDLALTFDARDAKPLTFGLDRRGATGIIDVMPNRRTGVASVGSTVHGPQEEIRVRPSRTAAPGQFTVTVAAHLGKPDGNGGFLGSPYQYHLQWSEDGTVPADLHRVFRDAELAKVRNVIAAQVPGAVDRKLYSAYVQPPATVTEFTSPGAAFFEDVYELDADNNLNWQIADLPRPAGIAGSTRTEKWNLGPFGPAFATSPVLPVVWCGRFGDQMNFEIPHFSDQNPDHFGFSGTLAEEMRMFRNGQPLISQDSEFGIFTVPPATATYRLETRSTRDTSPFSTEVRGAWTFRSGHVAGGPANEAALPMAALRFAPALDQQNRAAAGQRFKIPLYLQAQQGAVLGEWGGVTLDASYDDGATWQSAPVVKTATGFTATVTHPATTGFVSLRASATDSLGNKTELTIIHAYLLK